MPISEEDRVAIEQLLARQTTAWEAGDANAFGADVTDGVLFTNVMGMFSIGRGPFNTQHARIFATIYKGSRMEQEVVAITPIRPDVAIVDTLTCLVDAPHRPPGVELVDGAVRTRLEQVLVKDDGVWRVAAFHNVAVRALSMDEAPPQRA